jgi:hypothetical protein
MIYRTLEHAYQAAKFLDEAHRRRIQGTESPGATKHIARELRAAGHRRPDWNDINLDLMYSLVLQKFTHHAQLQRWLLATEDAELIEGNYWHDNFYGICTCQRCGNRGENHLGRILTEVRTRLSAPLQS